MGLEGPDKFVQRGAFAARSFFESCLVDGEGHGFSGGGFGVREPDNCDRRAAPLLYGISPLFVVAHCWIADRWRLGGQRNGRKRVARLCVLSRRRALSNI